MIIHHPHHRPGFDLHVPVWERRVGNENVKDWERKVVNENAQIKGGDQTLPSKIHVDVHVDRVRSVPHLSILGHAHALRICLGACAVAPSSRVRTICARLHAQNR